MLRAMFDGHGLSDPAQVGQLVASAQHSPSREEFPYDAAVVEAWFRGELLPTPEAFTAISDICHSRTNGSECDALEQAYELAEVHPRPRHLTELSVTLQARFKATGLTLKEMVREIARTGTPISESEGSAMALLSSACTGEKTFSPARLAACDSAFSQHGISGPPLATLHTLARIERSDATYTPPNTPDGSFGHMLKACRLRLGLGMQQMADAISEVTGKSLSHMSVNMWEKGSLPARDSFPNTDAITVYGTLLSAADAAQPTLEPWWTPTREQDMRSAHAKALAKALDKPLHGRTFGPAYRGG